MSNRTPLLTLKKPDSSNGPISHLKVAFSYPSNGNVPLKLTVPFVATFNIVIPINKVAALKGMVI